MTTYWTAAALIVGALGFASAITCTVAVIRLQRALLKRMQALESQAGTMDDAVRMIEARLSELHSSAAARRGAHDEGAVVGNASIEHATQAPIEPEIQAVIAAAAAVALGPKAQVRAVALVKPNEDASAWSQQGRVLVQTSHKLR